MPARVLADLAELPLGLPQPVGHHVGVLEQQRARLRERQPARPALEQLHPGLALQRRDLLGHRRLRERERLGGARERAEAGHLAEREHTARVDHRLSLWHSGNDDLSLWLHRRRMEPMQNLIALPLAHTATQRHLIGALATDRVPPDRAPDAHALSRAILRSMPDRRRAPRSSPRSRSPRCSRRAPVIAALELAQRPPGRAVRSGRSSAPPWAGASSAPGCTPGATGPRAGSAR